MAEATRRDGERRYIALGEYDGEVIRLVFTERGEQYPHYLGLEGEQV